MYNYINMNSEKESQIVKNVGIVSAVFLVLLLAGVSYFIISNQQVNSTVLGDTNNLEEPRIVRSLNQEDTELLYAISEYSRNPDGPVPHIGVPLEGSPGVFIVDLRDQHDEGIDSEGHSGDTGVVITK